MILSDSSQEYGQDFVVLRSAKDGEYKTGGPSSKRNQSIPLQLNSSHGSNTPQERAKAARARRRIAVLRGRVVQTRIGGRTQRAHVQQLRQETVDVEADFL